MDQNLKGKFSTSWDHEDLRLRVKEGCVHSIVWCVFVSTKYIQYNT